MEATSRIDVNFDFRSDTPGFPGRDPDACSPTLRSYHKLLWSKRLPNGEVLHLDDTTHHYLYHRSGLGEFVLTSDAVIPCFTKARRCAHIIDAIPREEQEAFERCGYTIGGMMVFPGIRVEGKMTINGARGCHPRIKDRFDLTVECIRRHYRDEASPLSDVLGRYAAFFGLFDDFRGYVDFFLLQDMVSGDYSSVDFFLPFQDFATSPLPGSIGEYQSYRERAINFIEARNRRILESC